MEDFLQVNKLAELHNGDTIIFCKTDNIHQDFDRLWRREKPVIFISGNSDYHVNDKLAENKPRCIVKWFCQNYVGHKRDDMVAIPLGIENSFPPSSRHTGWQPAQFADKSKLQIELLGKNYSQKPSKFAYVNFRNWTNRKHREQVKNECSQWSHFTMGEEVEFAQFVTDILDHECVVCAQGNDIGDNIRIYETLYLNRIPILFNMFMYQSLHYNFPNIKITDLNQLGDLDYLKEQKETAYERATNNWREMLNASYWINLIKSTERGLL
tara:strand:- start:1028 stop:1831 length:804 start_codon:yes stop_codon:yes gene_type:complete